MPDVPVPPELVRLWRLPATSRLGRPAGLDVERVVRTAVDLADRDGLDGVTLPKVASELGVTKMSLYPYVGSKAELPELMADLALGPEPDIAPGDWRAGLSDWASQLRAVYLRRPWLPRIPITGPPRGPNTIAWMEAALRQLRPTGLTWSTKAGIVMLIAAHVRRSAVLDQQLTAARRASGLEQLAAGQHYRRTLADLVDPARFPESAALLASGVFEPAPSERPDDHDFRFGLEVILNGVAVRIEGDPDGVGSGQTRNLPAE